MPFRQASNTRLLTVEKGLSKKKKRGRVKMNEISTGAHVITDDPMGVPKVDMRPPFCRLRDNILEEFRALDNYAARKIGEGTNPEHWAELRRVLLDADSYLCGFRWL